MAEKELREVYPLTDDDGWKDQTGPLPIRMTNDYMFRALLQSDNAVLKALLASLLHIDVSDIESAVVENPIMLGDQIDDKEYILDIRVDLNNEQELNLEMQVLKEAYWCDRSVVYLARLFDNLNRGRNYYEIKPARQIAFCDFTLFEDEPEFYSTYKLINVKKPNTVYSEKFILSNVDLKRIDLATEDDRKYHLVDWARLFTATTWEELKMIANENPAVEKAISDVWQMSQDKMIMEKCLAREEYYAVQAYKDNKIEELTRQNEEYAKQNSEYAKQNTEYAKQTEEYRKELADKNTEYAKQAEEYKKELADKDELIRQLEAALAARS